MSAQPPKPKKEETPINAGRKVFILNVNSPELPAIYWFDTRPGRDRCQLSAVFYR